MAGVDAPTAAAMSAQREEQTETKAERALRLLSEQAEKRAEAERQEGLRDALAAAEGKTSPDALKHVDCRTFGHSWEPVEADRNPQIGWYMNVRCARCGTVKREIVNRYGQVERRRYEYAEGYRDTDHWARSDWRMQYLRRLR